MSKNNPRSFDNIGRSVKMVGVDMNGVDEVPRLDSSTQTASAAEVRKRDELALWKARAEVERYEDESRAKSESAKVDTNLRKNYANMLFGLLVAMICAMFTGLGLIAGGVWSLPDSIVITTVVAVTTKVLTLVWLVVRYLFGGAQAADKDVASILKGLKD